MAWYSVRVWPRLRFLGLARGPLAARGLAPPSARGDRPHADRAPPLAERREEPRRDCADSYANSSSSSSSSSTTTTSSSSGPTIQAAVAVVRNTLRTTTTSNDILPPLVTRCNRPDTAPSSFLSQMPIMTANESMLELQLQLHLKHFVLILLIMIILQM